MVHHLIADSIVKHRGTRAILTDIALSCKTGEIVGVLGRNGSGKTTLLEIIYGVLNCEHKYLAVDGVKVNHLYSLRQTINYLPQHRFIPPYLTVSKAITHFLENDIKQAIYNDDIILSLTDKKIKELSFGDLRYLEIMLILSSPSKFTLLDEPFQGLAPITVERIQKLITKASQHRGIIIVDHNYHTVLELSNKLYILQESCLHPLKNPSELQNFDYLV